MRVADLPQQTKSRHATGPAGSWEHRLRLAVHRLVFICSDRGWHSGCKHWIPLTALLARMLRPASWTGTALLATLLLGLVSACSAASLTDSPLVSSSVETEPSLARLELGELHTQQHAFQLGTHYVHDRTAMGNRPPPPRTLRVGSLNIRYDYHSRHPVLSGVSSAVTSVLHHAKRPWGEHRWQERCDQLVDQVLFHDLDVVGFQEVLHGQLGDLQEMMGDQEWAHVGVGRDDGREAGEAVPIFYRRCVAWLISREKLGLPASLGLCWLITSSRTTTHRSRLELVSVQHSWLSPTPTVPGSKGWDAGQPRMITLARFRDLALTEAHLSSPSSGTNTCDLVVANTHWDDRGLEAREESAKLILRLVEEQVAAANADAGSSSVPLVVLVGDLNSPPSEAGYQVLTGQRYPVEDVKEPATGPVGPAASRAAFFDARHELVKRRSGVQVSGGAMSRYVQTGLAFPPVALSRLPRT